MRLEVFYDGACGLCRSSRRWTERRDPSGRVRFVDFRAAAEAELPVTPEALEATMWVRASDGRLLAGFDGWRRILAELPGWRWLARLTGLPPLLWLGGPAYRLLARFRLRLPGSSPAGCPDDACGAVPPASTSGGTDGSRD